MYLFHNSHDALYRSPFGAVPTGAKVVLSVKVNREGDSGQVYLCLIRGGTEELIPMSANNNIEDLYTAEVSVGDTPQLLWYSFAVVQGEKKVYYANNSLCLGGEGFVCSNKPTALYQITVYDKNYKTPDWFKGSIMYQIFPDRFYGVHEDCRIYSKREEYAIHYDWYEPLSFLQHPFEDGPACNDFYGGNLQGIQNKLSYLSTLGVGVLYLNPIFDAYSNHKYDTANYKEIDPMFGTEEDFKNLCTEAEKYGIRIILDGVFSHTGSDSIYFNKYGNYGENAGAYRDNNSPYRSWYKFCDNPVGYESWWGCSNLPNVNEMEPTYLDYILRDDDAVVKKWVRDGAYGWRLDVADELPDEFIKILRKELKAENPEAVLIGEVWEDASNKVAYGQQREYLLGYELDSVMNYPFKDVVLGFIMGTITPTEMKDRILSQIENYPVEALYSMMNIIGTHDTMRIKSLFGNMTDDCGTQRLSSGCEELAINRLKIASFMQMTFYGVPCIYYGDEVGMEGGRDPYNRGTYPWRHVDADLRQWYQTLGQLRNSTSCLKNGYFKSVYAENDVYAYVRYFDNGKDVFGNKGNGFALCAVNRSFEERRLALNLKEFEIEQLKEFFCGEILDIKDGSCEICLKPLKEKIWLKTGTEA